MRFLGLLCFFVGWVGASDASATGAKELTHQQASGLTLKTPGVQLLEEPSGNILKKEIIETIADEKNNKLTTRRTILTRGDHHNGSEKDYRETREEIDHYGKDHLSRRYIAYKTIHKLTTEKITDKEGRISLTTTQVVDEEFFDEPDERGMPQLRERKSNPPLTKTNQPDGREILTWTDSEGIWHRETTFPDSRLEHHREPKDGSWMERVTRHDNGMHEMFKMNSERSEQTVIYPDGMHSRKTSYYETKEQVEEILNQDGLMLKKTVFKNGKTIVHSYDAQGEVNKIEYYRGKKLLRTEEPQATEYLNPEDADEES